MPDKPLTELTRRTALAGLGAGLLAACDGGPAPADEADTSAKTEAKTGNWARGVPLPSPMQEIYPCAHEGQIHLAGGFIASGGRITGPTALHLVWWPGREQWAIAIPLPASRHHLHLVSFQGRLVALGGFETRSPDAVWVMQKSGWVRMLDRERWEPIPELPVACGEAVTAVTDDGLLHLAGGRSPAGTANASWQDHADQTHHFVLDGIDGTWQPAAPCLTARNSAAGDLIDGNWHVVGGRSVSGGNTAAHEVYDSREDRWRTAAPMPQAQGGLAAAALGGRLYAFGGEYFTDGGGVHAEAWAYDPARDAWEAIAPMPHPRHGLGAVTLDGAVYVIGGALEASGNETSALVEIFRP